MGPCRGILAFDSRLVCGTAGGSSFGVFFPRDEVYALHRTMGGIEKISFHSSRICRRAFLKNYPLPASMSDRVLDSWRRAETPTAGQMKAVAVLTIFFAGSHLSPDLPTTSKKVIRLDAPSDSAVRIVQLFFTRDSQAEVLRLIEDAGQQLIFQHCLPNGEGVVIRSWANSWEQPDIIMPASHGTTEDMIFPATYETGIARPVVLTMYVRSDELRCFELTGFRLPAGEARRRFPQADTFSRNGVPRRGRLVSADRS
jgi:hypothetical protein